MAFSDYTGFTLTSVMETHCSPSMSWVPSLLPEPPKFQFWLSQVLCPDVPEVCYHWQSLTKESSPGRHRADEERFSRCLETLTPEVAQEILSNACLQLSHGNCVKIYSQAPQPFCFHASACCWRCNKRTTNTFNNKPVHNFWISRVQHK